MITWLVNGCCGGCDSGDVLISWVVLLRILLLITWLLSGIGDGCDRSRALIGWVILMRPPMGYHTDFLFFFP